MQKKDSTESGSMMNVVKTTSVIKMEDTTEKPLTPIKSQNIIEVN